MKQMKHAAKDKLWIKYFFLIMMVNFFISVSNVMQGATIPMYVQHIGGSKSIVGIITGIYTLSALLFRPWFGNLVDNRGRKLVLIAGLSILTFASLSYNLAYTVGMLFLLRVLQGIGLSAQSTALGTIISDIVPPSKLGKGLSYNGIASSAAMAVAPGIGLYLIEHYNYNIFFYVTFVFGALALLSALFINYESKGDNARQLKTNVIFERTAVPASTVVFFILLTFSSIFTFVPVYAISLGIKNIGAFFMVYAFAFSINSTITSRLTKRYGDSKVIILGMILMILSFIIIAFAAALSAFLIAAALFGFGFSATQPALNALALSLCPEERRGAANATFYSAMDIGFCIGAVVCGIISQKLGFSFIYLTSAFCILLSLAIYVKLFHNDRTIRVGEGSLVD